MPKFNRGEIWIIDLDPTIGREQAKKRPCLILSSNSFNKTSVGLVIVIPITTKKKNIPLHIPIDPGQSGLKIFSYIMCEQIRSVSIERIENYSGKLDEDILLEIEYILKKILDFY